MKHLRILAIATLLMGAATAVEAQQPQGQAPGQGRGMGGGRMMQMLMEGITLSAEQQAKVDSITSKYTAQRQQAMQNDSLDMDTRRATMRGMMMKQQEELKALLTDEQKKVFEKNAADMASRMQQGGGQRPPR